MRHDVLCQAGKELVSGGFLGSKAQLQRYDYRASQEPIFM